jgi:flagellar hook-length control protein FliK
MNPDAAQAGAESTLNSLEGSAFAVPTGLGLQEMKFEAGNPEAGKAAVSAFTTSQAIQKPTAVSSTLSTDDYLNLRNSGPGLKKGVSKLSLNTAEIGTPVAPLNLREGHAPVATLTAPVTTGSMQKPVLSHDALHQMTQQVSLMNQAKQDGEIKIRMKPDHLGELTLNVKNHGQQISIHIHAQDPEARQIIESSLGSLRDSLSQQNLTVSRMEVTHAPAAVQTQDPAMQMDLGQFSRQQSDTGFQQEQHRESLANRNYWKDEDSVRTRVSAAPVGVTRARNATQTANGLDLIA